MHSHNRHRTDTQTFISLKTWRAYSGAQTHRRINNHKQYNTTNKQAADGIEKEAKKAERSYGHMHKHHQTNQHTDPRLKKTHTEMHSQTSPKKIVKNNKRQTTESGLEL